MKTFHSVLVICLTVLSLSLQSPKLFGQNIQTNVQAVLVKLDHMDEKLILIDIAHDGHAAYFKPVDNQNDPVETYIKEHRKDWKGDPRFAKFILVSFHKGAIISYRQNASPSLQFTKHVDIIHMTTVWEIDLDDWCPLKGPISFVKHAFGEVIPHALFHTHTSESYIAFLMAKHHR